MLIIILINFNVMILLNAFIKATSVIVAVLIQFQHLIKTVITNEVLFNIIKKTFFFFIFFNNINSRIFQYDYKVFIIIINLNYCNVNINDM